MWISFYFSPHNRRHKKIIKTYLFNISKKHFTYFTLTCLKIYGILYIGNGKFINSALKKFFKQKCLINFFVFY